MLVYNNNNNKKRKKTWAVGFFSEIVKGSGNLIYLSGQEHATGKPEPTLNIGIFKQNTYSKQEIVTCSRLKFRQLTPTEV